MVILIVVLGIRTYGGSLLNRFQGASGARDVLITRYEFRTDAAGSKPTWIIGFRNTSSRHTYNNIELEASYADDGGKVLQTDKLLVHQKLAPGQEELIASTDIKERPGATKGTLKITGAASVNP